MIPLQPPAQVQAPPRTPMFLADAVYKLLDEYDKGGDGANLPELEVAAADRPSLRWLRAGASQDPPENPFLPQSPSWIEAESIRALIQSPPDRRAELLGRTSLAEPGSQIALWRWGKRLARTGAFPPALRSAWEDTLLEAPQATVVSSYALRHALSFALAAEDLDRFAALKAQHSNGAPELLLDFQRLFGLLGSPGPRFTFWTLPEIGAEEHILGTLGGRRVWIHPLEGMALPVLPEGTVWLIPTAKPPEDPAEPQPPSASVLAGQASLRLRPLQRSAWLSPVPGDLESLGLTIYPVLVEVDGEGNLKRIRMGDAAPAAP